MTWLLRPYVGSAARRHRAMELFGWRPIRYLLQDAKPLLKVEPRLRNDTSPCRLITEGSYCQSGKGEPLPSDRSRATMARLQGERSEKRPQSSSRMRPLPS